MTASSQQPPPERAFPIFSYRIVDTVKANEWYRLERLSPDRVEASMFPTDPTWQPTVINTIKTVSVDPSGTARSATWSGPQWAMQNTSLVVHRSQLPVGPIQIGTIFQARMRDAETIMAIVPPSPAD